MALICPALAPANPDPRFACVVVELLISGFAILMAHCEDPQALLSESGCDDVDLDYRRSAIQTVGVKNPTTLGNTDIIGRQFR